MLNIVVPMAGRGSRFAEAGFSDPKPLIKIHDKHMIQVVINNLKPTQSHRFIFVCQNEHVREYCLDRVFAEVCDDYQIVGIDGITEGAAVTVLKAREFIDNDSPLMIANSDQWVDIEIDDYLSDIDERHLDGSMLTMKASDPKWSYAKVDYKNRVTEVVEKKVVSDEATVGIYNFKKGTDFCRLADRMIEQGLMSNGEFYVAPVYTLMASEALEIGIYNVGKEADGMYGLGIPNDLEIFLSSKVLEKATNF